MNKHELKTCPHCQAEFECKSGDILNCQCQSVSLKQTHHDYIAQHYDDCLCASCIKALRSEYNIATFKNRLQQIMT